MNAVLPYVSGIPVTIACIILLPSERDTGHRGHSYQLVCYNFSSKRCFVIRMLYDSL